MSTFLIIVLAVVVFAFVGYKITSRNSARTGSSGSGSKIKPRDKK